MDWSTVLLLAGVTLLEGFRRVPAGALVARCGSDGRWSIGDAVESGRMRLVSWAAPLILHVVLPPVASETREQSRDWAPVGRSLPWLRLAGTLQLGAVILGVPAFAAWWGAAGALGGIWLVLQGAVLLTLVSALVLHACGLGGAAATRSVRGLLSPFAAPRAAELVIETALAHRSAIAAARVLLGSADFEAWIRPRAWDALHGRGADPELCVALDHPALARLIRTPPVGLRDAERWCPRCAQIYAPGPGGCADCVDVPLVGGSADH